MTLCRSLADIEAAVAQEPPDPVRPQEQANRIAAILAPYICRECGELVTHAPGCEAAS